MVQDHMGKLKMREIGPCMYMRRDAISFSSSCGPTTPRLERRGGISLDSSDKSAIYVRMLGDVRMRDFHESLKHQKQALIQNDLSVLQGLSHPLYKTRCGQRFLTVHGMKKKRQSILRTLISNPSSSSKDSQAGVKHLLDDCYTVQAKCLLRKDHQWAFNVFALDKATNGRSLSILTIHLLQKHGLIDHFKLDIIKLMKFTSLVEEGYHQNPYHNAIHAADVAQAMHCFISEPKIGGHMTPIEKLMCIVAAVTHDIDHPGVNQAFLIATANHLAELYGNRSVLENHHWRTGASVLRESGLIDHLSTESQQAAYAQLTELIMATDMSRQQEFFCRLKKHNDDGDVDMSRFEHRHFILQIALKCADINNPARPWHICKIWADRVCQEFYQQGDFERRLKLPVTNMCDRKANSVKSIQLGFISLVVLPLFREWDKFLDCSLTASQVENVERNLDVWKSLAEGASAPASVPSLPPTHRFSRRLPTATQTVSEVKSMEAHLDPSLVSKLNESDSLDGSIHNLTSPALMAMAADRRRDTAAAVKEDEVNANLFTSLTINEDTPVSIQRQSDRVTSVGPCRSPQLSMVARLTSALGLQDERRHSLPASDDSQYGPLAFFRRDSFPSENRRMSVPVTTVSEGAVDRSATSAYLATFDKLVDRLLIVDDYSGNNNNNNSISPRSSMSSPLTIETMVGRPRISSLCPAVEASRLTNFLLSSKKVEVN